MTSAYHLVLSNLGFGDGICFSCTPSILPSTHLTASSLLKRNVGVNLLSH